MPVVSIIVPIYNVEKYLEKCIHSILNQTYKNLEIILVDDGSPDRCGEICDQYAKKDGRIIVLHQKNRGLGAARNAGIARASGKYLLFIDSDDYVDAELAEKTVKLAEDENADIVIFDYLAVEAETGREDLKGFKLRKNEIFSLREQPEALLITPSACNKLYRRDLFLKTGMSYPEGRYYEDLGTTPKLFLQAERMVYLDSAPLYYYILRNGSIIHSKNFEKNFQDKTFVFEDILRYFEECHQREMYEKELEYLAFENLYFFSSKEIILADKNSLYLEKFKDYVEKYFPEMMENVYIKKYFSKKDKLFLWLMKRKYYNAMNVLSKIRKTVDTIKKG